MDYAELCFGRKQPGLVIEYSNVHYFRSVPETLTLTAISHLVHGVVRVEEPVSDITVTIR